jgi:hypothetical protein
MRKCAHRLGVADYVTCLGALSDQAFKASGPWFSLQSAL